MPQPIELRISPAPDGRYLVTGLLLGATGPLEVTTATLRDIRLAEIVARLFEDYDPGSLGKVAEWAQPWAPGPSALESVRGATRAELPDEIGSRGPDDASLREFAQTYLTEMARRPRRAMTEAAARHRISRATANRWADLCRQRGYLPPKESR